MTRTKRLALAGSLLLSSTIAVGLHGTAYAHISTCRSDPVVWLSNGMKLNLSAQIADDPSDVTLVHYDLTIPKDVSVTKVVYTQGPIGRLETLSLYSGNGDHAYTDVGTLDTVSKGLSYTAAMQVVDQTTDWNETLTGSAPANTSVEIDETNAQ